MCARVEIKEEEQKKRENKEVYYINIQCDEAIPIFINHNKFFIILIIYNFLYLMQFDLFQKYLNIKEKEKERVKAVGFVLFYFCLVIISTYFRKKIIKVMSSNQK